MTRGVDGFVDASSPDDGCITNIVMKNNTEPTDEKISGEHQLVARNLSNIYFSVWLTQQIETGIKDHDWFAIAQMFRHGVD